MDLKYVHDIISWQVVVNASFEHTWNLQEHSSLVHLYALQSTNYDNIYLRSEHVISVSLYRLHDSTRTRSMLKLNTRLVATFTGKKMMCALLLDNIIFHVMVASVIQNQTNYLVALLYHKDWANPCRWWCREGGHHTADSKYGHKQYILYRFQWKGFPQKGNDLYNLYFGYFLSLLVYRNHTIIPNFLICIWTNLLGECGSPSEIFV